MVLPRLHSKQHLPALDGLRGLAILGVLACHFVRVGPGQTDMLSTVVGAVSGFGWLGVDLFFVLSGFLITGILLDTKTQPRYFRNFYIRRTLRIFPLYYAYLLGFIGLFFIAYMKSHGSAQSTRALHDSLWAIPYLTNVQIAIGGMKITTVLNHFWSLAIEEQFYLIWPAVVCFTSRRQLGIVCFILIIVATASRFICVKFGYIEASHTLMPCRADSLSIGALLALACRAEGGFTPLARIPRWCLLLLVLPALGCALSDSSILAGFFPGAVAMAFGVSLLFALTTPDQSHVGRLLSSPVLRMFGKYSYGLYVFNQPIAFFPDNVRFHEKLAIWVNSPLAATAIYAITGISLTFAAAWLSWHVMEKRFLELKERFA